MTRPNKVFYLLAAIGGSVVLAALMAGAHALGKRRQLKQPWLIERGTP